MSTKLVVVNFTDTIGKARSEMARADRRKILVLKNGEPLGILEDWLAAKIEQKDGRDVTIEKAFGTYKLEAAPVRSIASGTPLSRVKEELTSYAALVVLEPDRTIKGIITPSDLDKLWQGV